MEKNRLEAFSDGVIAIVLTIMVLELKVPQGHTLAGLSEAWPVFGAYLLSYWNVYLIWMNHHTVFSRLESASHPLLAANGLLLFVTSLIPFATAFANESRWTEPVPVALYGLVMACVSAAFVNLRRVSRTLTAERADVQAAESRVSTVMGAAFILGAGGAWVVPRLALVCYALVPLVLMIHRRLVRTGVAATTTSSREPAVRRRRGGS